MKKRWTAAFLVAMLIVMVSSGFLEKPLIEGYSRLCALVNESGNAQVLLGKNGYLFFSETLADYLGKPLKISALAEKIKAFSNELSAQGIGFTFVCAPNKNSVYPENMPYYALKGENQLPQLNQTLAALGVEVLDAYTLLNESKTLGPVYHQTDSHWNGLGALLVYRELMTQLDQPFHDYAGSPLGETPFRGDLVRLYRPLSDDIAMDWGPDIPREYTTRGLMRSVSDMRIETNSQANSLHVLVLRDSFGDALFPYLANNIGHMVYSRQTALNPQVAIDENVSHVVLVIAQRNLENLLEY